MQYYAEQRPPIYASLPQPNGNQSQYKGGVASVQHEVRRTINKITSPEEPEHLINALATNSHPTHRRREPNKTSASVRPSTLAQHNQTTAPERDTPPERFRAGRCIRQAHHAIKLTDTTGSGQTNNIMNTPTKKETDRWRREEIGINRDRIAMKGGEH